MHFKFLIAKLLPRLELLDDVWLASGGDKGREPIEPGHDPVLDLASRDMTRPADDARNAEAAFHSRSLTASKRRLAAIRPSKVFRTVVGREGKDRVALDIEVFELLHDRADDIVELRHPGFFDGPAVLGSTHVFVLFREMGDDMHACRIKPDKEGLVVVLRLFDEIEGEFENFVVYRFHPLGIERPGIFYALFADLSPARLHGWVIHVRRPGVDHVAGSNCVLEGRWIVAMRRVLHCIQVI